MEIHILEKLTAISQELANIKKQQMYLATRLERIECKLSQPSPNTFKPPSKDHLKAFPELYPHSKTNPRLLTIQPDLTGTPIGQVPTFGYTNGIPRSLAISPQNARSWQPMYGDSMEIEHTHSNSTTPAQK